MEDDGESMQDKIAQLASLVECSHAEATAAMEKAGGDVALAVSVHFAAMAGGPDAAAAAASQPVPVAFPGIMLDGPIELDDSEDEAAPAASSVSAPVAPAAAALAAAPAAAAPSPAVLAAAAAAAADAAADAAAEPQPAPVDSLEGELDALTEAVPAAAASASAPTAPAAAPAAEAGSLEAELGAMMESADGAASSSGAAASSSSGSAGPRSSMFDEAMRLLSIGRSASSSSGAASDSSGLAARAGSAMQQLRRRMQMNGLAVPMDEDERQEDAGVDAAGDEPMPDAQGDEPDRPGKRKAVPGLRPKEKAKKKKKDKHGDEDDDEAEHEVPEGPPPLQELAADGWSRFETPLPDQAGSIKWQQSILAKDPPALSLRSAKDMTLPTEATPSSIRGLLRTQHGCSSRSLFTMAERKNALRATLLGLRYPPDALECFWRMQSAPLTKSVARHGMSVPEDLLGKLPTRPFPLQSNLGGPEASQPPHFEEYQLRPEQLRSLAWMLQQESPAAPPFGVEWRRFMPHNFEHVPQVEYWMTSKGVEVWDGFFKWSKSVHKLTSGTMVQALPGVKCSAATGWYEVVQIVQPVAGYVEKKHLKKKADSSVQRPELRVHASYNVKGGILADRIGYGKTATTIGLIDTTLRSPLPPIPAVDKDRFVPAKGTLILVPSNLLDQWMDEIGKFVHKGRMKFANGWSPESCPWKILALKNVTPLKAVTAKQVADADVVICSYRLLYSTIYQARRRGMVTNSNAGMLHELVSATESVIKGRRGAHLTPGRGLKQPMKRGGVPGVDDAVECTNMEDIQFPLLELFYWRRVVYDEFHELESFESTQQNSLQHMRAHFRWGLTGTPPVDSNSGAIVMSSLFRIDLPGYLETAGSNVALAPWEGDKLMTQMARRFLDRYVRQNSAELPEIPLEEHIIQVRHTQAERALYLGQAHDAPDLSADDAFSTVEKVKAVERLLSLCSHFQAGGGEVAENAAEECRRIGNQKEKRSRSAILSLERCCRVLLLLEGKLKRLVAQQNRVLQNDLAEFKRLAQSLDDDEDEPALEAVTEAAEKAHGAAEEAAQSLVGDLPSAPALRARAIVCAVEGVLVSVGKDFVAHFSDSLPKAITETYEKGDDALKGWLQARVKSWRQKELLPLRQGALDRAVGLEPSQDAPPDAAGEAAGDAAGEASGGAEGSRAAPAPASGSQLPEVAAWRDRLGAELRTLQEEGSTPDAPGRQAAKRFVSALTFTQREGNYMRIEGLVGHKASDDSGLAQHIGAPPPRSGHTKEQWTTLFHKQLDRPEIKKLMEAQAQEQLRNLKELRDALASQAFFFKAIETTREGSDPEARSCSVCLEDDLPLTKLSITPCAHTFCTDCLKATVKNFKSCSICRHKLSEKDVVPLSYELAEEQPKEQSSSSSSKPAESQADQRYNRYGTKLARLVEKLHELRHKDATSKVILFVQFDDLKKKVAEALREFGVSAATLQGSAAERGRIIRDWQENLESSTFVLLLSLGASASGTNLTAASHVIFLHPMLAENTEKAMSYELQAIGRARRFGQKRDRVHVWRFVTTDTVEQELTQRHQAALWHKSAADAAAAAMADAAAAAAAAAPAAPAAVVRPPPR